ncbi:MAG TPA: cyclase family protein [Bryobacteraceae bacterium]|nr:cyclase family protein [Bryobacteraceae bacterium]
MRVVDLSRPVGAGTPVFPGDGPAGVTILSAGEINLSRIDLSLHTGTHMDAPFHFFTGGETIDRVPLARCMGPARRIDLRRVAASGTIGPAHLLPHADVLRQARIAVLDTGWSQHWGAPDYFTDHPCLTGEAAQFLLDCSVQLVCVDMPSIDLAPYAAHRILLGAGVPIVENLTNLDAIGADAFELIVLPLKLAGRDGSPVRAVAMVSEL